MSYLKDLLIVSLSLLVLSQGTGYKAGQIISVVDAVPFSCVSDNGEIILQKGIDPKLYLCKDNVPAQVALDNGGVGIEIGDIILRDSGEDCPSGYSALNLGGRTILVNSPGGDVGTTGGSDLITPAGTNGALTFTGSSANTNSVSAGTPAGTNGTSTVTPLGTNQALTFTGTLSTTVVNHVHTLATGTTATGNFSQVIGTVDTTSGGTGGTPTQTALGTLSGNPTVGGAANYTPAGTINTPTFTGSSSTVAAQTFTGSAMGTHQHTLTATGTINTPSFTGTQFDNRSAFYTVYLCKRN